MFLTEVNANIEVNDNKAWSQDFINKSKKKRYHQKNATSDLIICIINNL